MLKLKDLYEELLKTEPYKEFIIEHPDAYLTAGFFMLSESTKESDTLQLDFYLPQEHKMVSFAYPFTECVLHPDVIHARSALTNFKLALDLDMLTKHVEKLCKTTFTKIIAILQDDVWNITALKGIDIRRIKINAYDLRVIQNEALAFNDLMRFKRSAS